MRSALCEDVLSVADWTSYVERHTNDYAATIATKCLYQYREPMSPHLAAKLAPDLVCVSLALSDNSSST